MIKLKSSFLKMKNPFLINPFKSFSHSAKVHGPKSLRDSVLKDEFQKKIETIDSDSSKKDRILKKIVGCIDAKKDMEEDLTKIQPAREAIRKISNNETPLKKEFDSLCYLQKHYRAYFDDSDSDSGSESNENVNKTENKIENIENLGVYLRDECKACTKESFGYKNKLTKLTDDTSKRKLEESGDPESSKKTRQSVHDFVENLPTDYNPLDDIGLD